MIVADPLILERELPEKVRFKGGVAFFRPGATALSSELKQIDFLPHKAATKEYKGSLGRRVFSFEIAGKEYIAKHFELNTLKKYLNKVRYASAEAANLILARKRNIKTPEVFGVIEYTRFGVTVAVAVIMERISGDTLRDEVFIGNANEHLMIVKMFNCGTIVRQLHLAGIHHLDFGPHALINVNAELYCIDFQYASFYRNPVAENTAHMVGYFGWSVSTNRNWVPRAAVNAWYDTFADLFHDNEDQCRNVFENALLSRDPVKIRARGYGS